MTRQAVGRVSQRAPRIWLCMPHRTVPALVLLVAMSRATVRGWMGRFKAPGPAGLSEAPRRGRPRQRSPQVVEARRTRRQDDPRPAGSLAPCGTVVMLGVALVQRRGVRRSVSTRRARGAGGSGGAAPADAARQNGPCAGGQAGGAGQGRACSGSRGGDLVCRCVPGQLLPVVRALGTGGASPYTSPPLAPLSRGPCWGRCISGPGRGDRWSMSGGAPTMASPSWSRGWSPIQTVPSGSAWPIAAATRPRRSIPGGPPPPACAWTPCRSMVPLGIPWSASGSG